MRSLLAIVCILLGACGSSEERGQGGKRITLAIGGRRDLVYAPASIAESLGHYRAENIDVAITDMSGGSKALEALLGGSADVVCGFYDHPIQLAAENRGLKAFVVLSTSYAEAIAVSPKTSRKIEKLEDLKGATIGVTAPGSSTNFFATFVLGQHGIGPKDFSVVGTGSAVSRISALEYGKVDAAVLLEPSISYLTRRHPNLKIFADTRTREGSRQALGSDVYPTAVFYSTERWLTNNQTSAHALARAMIKTLHWIAEHSPEKIAQAMPASLRLDDQAAYVEAFRKTKDIFSRDGVMPHEGAEAVLKVMKAVHPKLNDVNIDLSKTYTNEFVSAR